MFLTNAQQEVFSPLEVEVIEAIGNNRVTLQEIAKKVYKNAPVRYGSTAVSVMIKRINAKVERNGLNFTVRLRGSNGGPVKKTVYITKK